jgi:hypothetical protein
VRDEFAPRIRAIGGGHRVLHWHAGRPPGHAGPMGRRRDYAARELGR